MANVGDVVKRGDHVKVKVLSISGTKLSLSMRVSIHSNHNIVIINVSHTHKTVFKIIFQYFLVFQLYFNHCFVGG